MPIDDLDEPFDAEKFLNELEYVKPVSYKDFCDFQKLMDKVNR